MTTSTSHLKFAAGSNAALLGEGCAKSRSGETPSLSVFPSWRGLGRTPELPASALPEPDVTDVSLTRSRPTRHQRRSSGLWKWPGFFPLSLILFASPLSAQPPPNPLLYGPPTASPTPQPPQVPAAAATPPLADAEPSGASLLQVESATSAVGTAAPKREWLASRETGWQQPTSPGFGAWGLLFAFVAAAAGLFWFQRWRLRQRKTHRVHPELTVLARSRLGARSEVVVVEFGGAVTMLGVTESRITCLQTLSDTLFTERAEQRTLAISEEDPFEDTNPGHPVPFAAHLERGLRDVAAPAVELAEQTPDRTNIRHGGKRKHLVDIEGQAAGLAQRLQRRESGG